MGCVLDTATVDLDTTGGVLTANAKVSADAGNALSAHADGLYALPGLPAGLGPLPYAGSVLPSGWLFCDGSAVNRSTYAALFAAIGTTYGVGDGATTFNLPDSRGRVEVGKGSNVAVDALNKSDGVSEANRRPQHKHTPHSHTYNTGNYQAAFGVGGATADTNAVGSSTGTADGGSGVSTDSLDAPAYIVVNKIIKT